MNLEEFVRNTLVEIAEGVEAAQNHDKSGGQIAPSAIGGHELPEGKGVTHQARIVSTVIEFDVCLLYTSPSPRDRTRSRMPSSA